MGFTTYIRPVVTQPTIQEILASLSGTQKLAVLNGFADNVPAGRLKHILPIPVNAIQSLYSEIAEVRDLAIAYMLKRFFLRKRFLIQKPGKL